MLRNIIFALVITAGCGGKKSDNNAGSGSAGSAMAGSGSSMAGSGSAMAGSGSAMAGSGSDAGSGSAMAGSGSAMAGSGSAGSAAAGSGSDAGSGSATAEAPPPPPPDDFIKKSKDDKMKIMKEKVMPAMAKAFKGHDAKKFAKFNCKTCHGKGADDKTWKMPNPDIPALDFEALKAGKQEPEMAKFMAEVVTPDMAKILELRHFDPKEPEKGGFGCLACHVMKK